MSLSDKIYGFGIQRRKVKKGFFWEEDVKQFIKNLKEDLCNDIDLKKHKTLIEVKINRKAGEKLI